jgi:hypothetical protein
MIFLLYFLFLLEIFHRFSWESKHHFFDKRFDGVYRFFCPEIPDDLNIFFPEIGPREHP